MSAQGLDAGSAALAPILSVSGLAKHFPIRNAWRRTTGWLKALDGVSFDLPEGGRARPRGGGATRGGPATPRWPVSND